MKATQGIGARSGLLAYVMGLALMCHPRIGSAELVIADSVEWLTARSALVVRGVVTDSKTAPEHGARHWRQVSFRVTQVVKAAGKKPAAGKPLTFYFSWWKDEPLPSGELLVFLTRGSEARHAPKELKQAWVATPHNFAFETPLLDISKPKTTRVVSRSFQMLETREALLGAVSTAATTHPTVSDTSVTLDAPFDSSVHGALYGGSAVMVTVPWDAALMRWAETRRNHKETSRRLEAAKVFAARKTERSVAVLQELLEDPGYWAQRTSGVPGGYNLYPVRRLAFETLRKWGVKTKKPVIEEPFD